MSAFADPAHALTATGNLRRRLLVSRIATGGMVAAAGLAVIVLFALVFEIAREGLGSFSWALLTHDLPGGPDVTPGLGPAFLGSAEIVMIAALFAAPVGIASAIYLSEFAHPRLKRPLTTSLDLMAGMPTIILGIFVYLLWTSKHGQSALPGAIALGIVMTPLIARASLEAISRVPHSLREAADAVGVARWRTVMSIVLPTASAGITTGLLLAVARGAGETAPLLFATSDFQATVQFNPLKPIPNIPLFIYSALETGQVSDLQIAWGGAFVLMLTILLTNIVARVMLRRGERKRGL